MNRLALLLSVFSLLFSLTTQTKPKLGYSLRSVPTSTRLSLKEVSKLNTVEKMNEAIRTNPAAFATLTDFTPNQVIKGFKVGMMTGIFAPWCKRYPEKFTQLLNRKIIRDQSYFYLERILKACWPVFAIYYQTAQKNNNDVRCDFEGNTLPDIFCQNISDLFQPKTCVRKIKKCENHVQIQYKNILKCLAQNTPKAFLLYWDWLEQNRTKLQTDFA